MEHRPVPKKKCVFCQMTTDLRFLRVRMCVIYRDQCHDFLWVLTVQVVFGGMPGTLFAYVAPLFL